MELIKQHNKFPLNIKWDYTQIDFINPTDNAVTIDIFNSVTISNFNTIPSSGSSFPNSISFQTFYTGASLFAAFCPVNQFVYIGDNSGSPRLVVFDTVNNVFVTDIPLANAISGQIVYDSINNRMYGGTSLGTVIVIDCATNTVLTTVFMGVLAPVFGLDFSPIYNSVYCTQPSADTAYRIDCVTNTVVNILAVSLFTPRAIKFNSVNNGVYIFNTSSPTVVETDFSLIVGTIYGIPNPASNGGAAAFVPTSNSIYFQQIGTNDILQLECGTGVINPVVIPFPAVTNSILYNPISDLVYVSKALGFFNDGTYIYNPATNGLVQFVPAPSDDYGTRSDMVLQTVKNTVYTIARRINAFDSGIYELGSASNFYIDSPYNYNALLQDIQTQPMLIRRIELITQNQEQFTQPFSIMNRDANGVQVIKPRLPNIELSVNQAQPNIASIDFHPKELILDDNTMFSQYTFPKKSVTRILIYYKQVSRIDFLSNKLTNCHPLENYLNFKEAVSITEAELKNESNAPLIIQNVKNEEKKHMRLAGKMKMMDRLKKG